MTAQERFWLAGVMGQPFWQPSGPNGYADDTAAWASAESGAQPSHHR